MILQLAELLVFLTFFGLMIGIFYTRIWYELDFLDAINEQSRYRTLLEYLVRFRYIISVSILLALGILLTGI